MKKHIDQLFSGTITVPEVLKQSHFAGLDGLRAIAIILVILGHLFLRTVYTQTFADGVIGVEIFFVISGFLITSLLLKEKITRGHISLKNFYIRRALRILPPALLFLSVTAILNHFLKLGIPAGSFISSMFLVHNIPVIKVFNMYLEHFWSLSVEEQFYIIFPVLLVYNLKLYIKTIVTLIITVSVIEFLGFNNIGVFYSNHVVHVIAFVIINLFGNFVFILIGSLLAVMLFKGFFKAFWGYSKYLSLLLFGGAILIRMDSSPLCIPYSRLLLFPLLIGIVIVLNLNPKAIMSKILNNKILAYIGKLSYGIYLWQQLFIFKNIWLIHSNSIVLHLAVIFAIAVVSYHFYERFFLNLKDKFASRGKRQISNADYV